MDAYEHYLALIVALTSGLVIGFEREQAHAESEILGGARTHPLFALVGAVSAMLAPTLGAVPFIIGFAGLGALMIAAYVVDLRAGNRGITSESALLLTFLLGALAASHGIIEPASQRMLVVLSTSVVATLLLSIKAPLHSFIHRLSPQDVYATLKFLLVFVVILPLLPDETLGPLQVLNPRKIGFMVVLIAGLSFVGYVAVRVLGARRGLGVTGLVGGIVSSTAVTLSFSGRAKGSPSLRRSFALGVVLASSIMFARMLVITAVVNLSLAELLAIPLLAMSAAGLLVSAFFYFRRSRAPAADGGEVQFQNPFELSSALKFAAFYAAVLLASKAAATYLGTGATYLTGVLAGVGDVDAISLSMAHLAKETLPEKVAVTTILLAGASNTVVKGGLAVGLGGWAFGRNVAAAFGLVLIAGATALVGIWVL